MAKGEEEAKRADFGGVIICAQRLISLLEIFFRGHKGSPDSGAIKRGIDYNW